MAKPAIPRALTIAGSDSGGGAGIQADLKTFAALGVYGMSVITSLTAQNTRGVVATIDVSPDFVGAQLDAVLSDIGADSAKTGMLATAGTVEVAADRVRQFRIANLVVDPVMKAKDGRPLLSDDGQKALVRSLLPLATVVTPNLDEAEALTGRKVSSRDEMREAARAILALGPKHVLVKGGHLAGDAPAVDILFDGRDFHEFSAPRIATKNTHGTGCVFSAAITAGLAKGRSVADAVGEAKEFVSEAIRHGLDIGHGQGPVNPGIGRGWEA